MALRRRLEGVADISISLSEQTVEVKFTEGHTAFSPKVFRNAAQEAAVEVLTLQIDACGVIEQKASERWLAAGENRFLLVEGRAVPDGEAVCVSGRLDDRSGPSRLEITAVASQ
ncbi:MAG: hypothetical protein GEU99_19125 [Luteitalea sp.]|nr:hypothetical protein [Luteitalea sp.]